MRSGSCASRVVLALACLAGGGSSFAAAGSSFATIPQTPTLLGDLNPNPVGWSGIGASIMGGRDNFCVFEGADPTLGHALFAAGDTGEALRIAPLDPGTFDAPLQPVRWSCNTTGGLVFQRKYDNRIYRTGLGAGSTIVVEMQFNDTPLTGITAYRNGFIFGGSADAVAGTAYGTEPYISDGTPNGATLVADIRPGALGSNPRDFTFDGQERVYFVADDGVNGYQLWITDGTARYTRRLTSGLPDVRHLAGAGGRLFFAGQDAAHGGELWVSSGSAATTRLVKDINPNGTTGSLPQDIVVVNGIAYFSADDGVHGREFWRSDGSEVGTYMVADLAASGGSDPAGFAYNERTSEIWFSADDGVSGREPYVFGIYSGLAMAGDICPGACSSSPDQFTAANVDMVFAAFDPDHGREPWVKSMYSAPSLVADVVPGPGGSNPEQFTHVGLYSLAYFVADGRLYRSNGTAVPSRSMDPYSAMQSMAILGSHLYFTTSSSNALYRTNGTPAGTVNIAENAAFTGARNLVATNDRIYFIAHDPEHGEELWSGDGDPAHFALVEDIMPGPESSNPQYLTALEDKVVLFADDGVHGRELWQGDANGVYMSDRNPGPASFQPAGMPFFRVAGGRQYVFFPADDGVHGVELWRSNGSVTWLFDVVPGPGSSNPVPLAVYKYGWGPGEGAVFLARPNSPDVWEVWRVSIWNEQFRYTDTLPGGPVFPIDAVSTPHRVYFVATDDHGPSLFVAGEEIYTYNLRPADVTNSDWAPAGLYAVNKDDMYSPVLFTAYVPKYGREPWVRREPTWVPRPVGDYRPGALSSVSTSLGATRTSSGHIAFAAYNAARGYEPVRYNPLLDKIEELAEVVPGSGDAGPRDFAAAGNYTFFTGFTPETSLELYSLDTVAAGHLTDENSLRVRRNGYQVELSWSPGFCNGTDTSFGVYEGDLTTLSSAYSHTPVTCGYPLNSLTYSPFHASAYFLVNTVDWRRGLAGSLGRAQFGPSVWGQDGTDSRERPPDTYNYCGSWSVGECP